VSEVVKVRAMGVEVRFRCVFGDYMLHVNTLNPREALKCLKILENRFKNSLESL